MDTNMLMKLITATFSITMLFCSFVLVGCSSKESNDSGYTVTVNATGLNGEITISLGGQSVTISDNGNKELTLYLNIGDLYHVNILSKPETQLCNTEEGAFTISSGDNLVTIACEDRILTKDAIAKITDLNFSACLDSSLIEKYTDEVQFITCQNKNIESAVGTSYFKNLYSLNLKDNVTLTQIDVSENELLGSLHLNSAAINNIDISNTNLFTLELYQTNITDIDLSNNINLTNLGLSETLITSLDLSKLTNLVELNVISTDLISLDVSSNINLKVIYAGFTNIGTLDFSKNPQMEKIFVNDSNIISLNISNCERLITVVVRDSYLLELNTSSSSDLYTIDIHNTNVSSLDLTNNTNLGYLRITQTDISSLDLSSNTNLRTVYAYSLGMTAVNGIDNIVLKNADIWLTDNNFDMITLSYLQDLVDNQGFFDLHF